MQRFTTLKLADISTGHLTAKDCVLIGKPYFPYRLAKSAYGIIIWIPPTFTAEDKRKLRVKGASQGLISLITELSKAKIPYANFDRDGKRYKKLPYFDW